MSLMKFAIVGTLLLAIVVSNAEEAKSSQNSPQLTSSSSENRQQNKRLAIYGSSDTLHNSGFRPITTSFPSVNNYVGNHQLYSSAASNVYTKTAPSYNQYLASPAEKYASFRNPSYQQYPSYQSYHQYQPSAYAASHQQHASYSQPQGAYTYSSAAQAPQIYTQQIPFNQYHNQPINPVLHAAPIATFANTYQTAANTFYVNPQQLHKVLFYNQQPQAFNTASSYQPTNYHHHQHVKQFSQLSPQSQIITSKPVALETPIAAPTSSSLNHVNHNHGAVSYAHYSQSQTGDERKASAAAPLIATQTPQQVYYHHQPQQIYSNGDYNKHPIQYAAVPVASNYYPVQQQNNVHYGNVPYAHISKIPFAPPTAAASTLIPSIATVPQKVTYH